MNITKEGYNYFFVALVVSLLFLPFLVAAQPASTASLSKSMAKLLNIPESYAEGPNLLWFIFLPWALMFIVVYGILDEIKLFYKGMINFAIAFLATIMMIPTNVLGQIIIGIYGGGLSALVIVVGIGILPRFLERFGPRLGLPMVILELLTAAMYGLMMFFVFGFLTSKGGVLEGYSWIRWVATIGIPLLVLFRGWLGKTMSFKVGSDETVMQQEKQMHKRTQKACEGALTYLATLKKPGSPDKLDTVSDKAYIEALARTSNICSGRFTEDELRVGTPATLTKEAADVAKEVYT